MIDHEIVSIYTRGEAGNSSLVKFGGWDQDGLAAGEQLKMQRTHSANDLSLFFNHAKIGHFQMSSSTVKRRVHLNPAVKYIYMPDSDWQTITDYLQSFYDQYSHMNFTCDQESKQCYWKHSCGYVLSTPIQPQHLSVFFDTDNNYTVRYDRIVIDGRYFTTASEDYCYLGIFQGHHLAPGIWEFGSIAMLDYYIVFDMTLRNETDQYGTQQFRSIGFGRINEEDVIKQEHYNRSSSLYREDPLDVSYSLSPAPEPDDGQTHKPLVMLVSAILLALLLLGLGLTAYFKRRAKKKEGGPTEGDSASQQQSFVRPHNNHLQTMSTGRGTEVDSASQAYNSVLEDGEERMIK